jgi:hypothetical protein
MKELREEKARVRRTKLEVRMLKSYIPHTRSRGWSSTPSNGWTKAWDRGENHPDLFDPSKKKFYILVEKLGIATRNFGETVYAKDFLSFCNTMRTSGAFPDFTEDTPVFGLRSDSKLLQDANFIPLMPYLKAEMTQILTPAKQMELSLAVKPFSGAWEKLLEYIAGHPQTVAHDSVIRQFAIVLDKAKKANREGHDGLVKAATKLGFDIHNTQDFNKAWEKVIKSYPMLKICSLNWRSGGTMTMEDTNVLVDYIRYADEQTKRLNIVVSNVQIAATEEEEETANVA